MGDVLPRESTACETGLMSALGWMSTQPGTRVASTSAALGDRGEGSGAGAVEADSRQAAGRCGQNRLADETLAAERGW